MNSVPRFLLLFALFLPPLTVSAQLAYAANEKDGTISVIDTMTAQPRSASSNAMCGR